MTRPLVRDRELAKWGGWGALLLGMFLLRDAYERRGRKRPDAAKGLNLL